jgi:Flp pilus assembly protein TadD
MKTKDQVDTSPKIKTSVDRALRLDPNNDYRLAYPRPMESGAGDINVVKRVLAKAIYGDLPVTTNEEAERCLKKAIALNPNRLIHYIELGRIYAQMGRKKKPASISSRALHA